MNSDQTITHSLAKILPSNPLINNFDIFHDNLN